ncbi:IS66 family insertion sequence element accessory protein TnpB [Lysinibacillus sp. RC79]|uniref:IS66 family insertion sequence element accessory protein TnpB n=1 Tax=Lysinibacillus sp. RC79 TaxID=3156296 RepID=UPI003516159D
MIHIVIPSSYFLERVKTVINVCLYFDGDGFAILYKRLDNGKLQWPKDEKEVRNLSQKELRWLLEGLSLQQPKAIMKSAKGVF